MARRKQAEEGGIKSEWIATFADLMNLLLCFFVLLFALSTVDGVKFEKVSISMANSIGILKGGTNAVSDQELISAGVAQVSNLTQIFSSMSSSINIDANSSDNTDQGTQGSTGAEGVTGSSDSSEGTEGETGAPNNNSEQSSGANSNTEIEEALETIEDERAEVTSNMYDKVSDLTDEHNLRDYVDLKMDPDYRFIQLTIKGSILFESGSAMLISGSEPILKKVGDVLKDFDGYQIEITGHTDNVPMTSKAYKDNNWLSAARALNAADFLITNCNLDPLLLKYSGRGEYEPTTSNATAEGRALNRRIEIKIYNEYSGG